MKFYTTKPSKVNGEYLTLENSLRAEKRKRYLRSRLTRGLNFAIDNTYTACLLDELERYAAMPENIGEGVDILDDDTTRNAALGVLWRFNVHVIVRESIFKMCLTLKELPEALERIDKSYLDPATLDVKDEGEVEIKRRFFDIAQAMAGTVIDDGGVYEYLTYMHELRKDLLVLKDKVVELNEAAEKDFSVHTYEQSASENDLRDII